MLTGPAATATAIALSAAAYEVLSFSDIAQIGIFMYAQDCVEKSAQARQPDWLGSVCELLTAVYLTLRDGVNPLQDTQKHNRKNVIK